MSEWYNSHNKPSSNVPKLLQQRLDNLRPHFDRYFELFDLIANFIGILLAITFADLVTKYYSY